MAEKQNSTNDLVSDEKLKAIEKKNKESTKTKDWQVENIRSTIKKKSKTDAKFYVL